MAEKKNKTMMDMVRCKLHNKNWPKSFWMEVVAYTIYVLNKCPRAWYTCIDSYFLEHGFCNYPYKRTLYIRTNMQKDIIILFLYIDNLIFIYNNPNLLLKSEEAIIAHFEMTIMGSISYFLGIEVTQTSGGIFISQKKM